jgi:hypothetical protein
MIGSKKLLIRIVLALALCALSILWHKITERLSQHGSSRRDQEDLDWTSAVESDGPWSSKN